MQIKVHNKRILIFLLLCSLFLTSYISILDTNGMISSDLNGSSISSVSGKSEHASMNGGINAGHDDFLAELNTSTELSISSISKSRWPGAKNSFNMLIAVVAAQMAYLIHYSKLSDQTYIQSSSNTITVFLHKKDGMK